MLSVLCICDAVLAGDWESIVHDVINLEPHCPWLGYEGLAFSVPPSLESTTQKR